MKDMPHLVHVVASKTLLSNSGNDIRDTVVKLVHSLSTQTDRLTSIIRSACQVGCHLKIVKKLPAVLPLLWSGFCRMLVVVTEMWNCPTQLGEEDMTGAKT